jgi:hypothetical protein
VLVQLYAKDFVSNDFLALFLLLTSVLGAITDDNDAEMSWAHFEEKVVQRYHVDLVGWPEGIQFDIHKLGAGPLTLILHAMRGPEPTCFWEKLTAEEVDARKLLVPPKKPRKQRSDIGRKRARYSKKRLGAPPIRHLPPGLSLSAKNYPQDMSMNPTSNLWPDNFLDSNR